MTHYANVRGENLKKMKKYTTNKKSSYNLSRTLIFVSLLVIVGVASVLAYTKTNQPTENSSPTINLDPPTPAEEQAGNKVPEKQPDTTEQPTKPDNGTVSDGLDSRNEVTVIIADAGQYGDTIEVRSFMPNYFEDGTCTITFSRGNSTFSRDTPAYTDATSTICTNPEFKRSDFSSLGEWQVNVRYESTNAKGTSQTQTVNIQ